MFYRTIAIVVGMFLAISSAQGQTTWYVDDDGDPGNGCTGWPDACPELQTALSLASGGDQIWVAVGIYKPDYDVATGEHTGDRTATFLLINGVGLYGGFDGTEDTLEDRAELFELTILSGDLQGNDDPADFPQDHPLDPGPTYTENTHHVVTFETDEPAVLDGFTITAGNALGSLGGGVLGSYGTVRNCTLVGNIAQMGGGMVSQGPVTNCTFIGNAAETSGGGLLGGSSITDCTFIDNLSGSMGGGASSDGTVTGCTFRGNRAYNGGAMFNGGVNNVIMNCTFHQNSALSGGALFIDANVTNITNCTFVGNTAGEFGGAIGSDKSEPNEDLNVSGCTFAMNSASFEGGGFWEGDGWGTTISNCIFWGNSDSSGVSESAQIGFFKPQKYEVLHSCIQGLIPGGEFDNGTNVGSDPLFVRKPDPGLDEQWGTEDDDVGNIHLRPDSPSIDAANNAAVPADVLDLDDDGDTTEPIPFDLDGNPRFEDNPTNEDCWQAPGTCGDLPVVDMGAYEHVNADLDGDGDVDAADLALLLGDWGTYEPCPPFIPADIDQDCDVDAFDLALLLGNWG